MYPISMAREEHAPVLREHPETLLDPARRPVPARFRVSDGLQYPAQGGVPRDAAAGSVRSKHR